MIHELEQSFNHDIIYQGRWPTIAAHTVQLLQSHPCSEIKYSHHSYSLLDMVAAEVSHATIAVEKHHRWQEHQSGAWSSRIMGTPAVLTGILRGMHVVLCPRYCVWRRGKKKHSFASISTLMSKRASSQTFSVLQVEMDRQIDK